MLPLGANTQRRERLSPKARVLTTFAHGRPDRVPIDYAANPGIDRRLKAYYGLTPTQHEGLLQVLGVDFRKTAPPYAGPRLHPEVPERRVDPQWGIHSRYIHHGTGDYWEPFDWPLREADEEAVAAWPLPSPDDYDYAGLAARCRERGQYAVCLSLGKEIINFTGRLRSMAQVLMDLASDDPAGLLLLNRIQQVEVEVAARALAATKGLVDVVCIGQDLGTQRGPLVSLALFRKHIRPRLQRYVDLAKGYGLPVMIHTCGSSSWAFEDFIEMGIDAVDTLQPEAAQMSPTYLREHFGGRLVFHGCISTAGPVSFGSVEEVVRDVRQTLAIMMATTGYCFATTHMLQDNSPTENVVAMYETAHTYGWY